MGKIISKKLGEKLRELEKELSLITSKTFGALNVYKNGNHYVGNGGVNLFDDNLVITYTLPEVSKAFARVTLLDCDSTWTLIASRNPNNYITIQFDYKGETYGIVYNINNYKLQLLVPLTFESFNIKQNVTEVLSDKNIADYILMDLDEKMYNDNYEISLKKELQDIIVKRFKRFNKLATDMIFTKIK